MLSRPTVFIVGAGASSDLKFPLGSELKEEIAHALEPETTQDSVRFKEQTRDLWDEAIRIDKSLNLDSIRNAGLTIHNGIRFISSVDNFLEIRRHEPAITALAKATIASRILLAERRSLLRRSVALNGVEIDANRASATWLPEIAQILFERIDINNAKSALAKANFIVFNYDRSLEFFVSQALMAIYQMDPREAIQMIETKIIHPYGSLGPLSHMPYAAPASSTQKREMAQNLKTYSEIVQEDIKDKVQLLISNAEIIVFLGFGYHTQNMDLLFTRSLASRASQVLGTARGMSPEDRRIVTSSIRRGCIGTSSTKEVDPILEDASCSELLRNYKRLIAG